MATAIPGTAVFIQARMSSSRFPGKMLETLGGAPLVEVVARRCRQSRLAGLVAVVTSAEVSDDPLAAHCRQRGIPCFRGPLEDVLGRFLLAARHFGVHSVCRVCGDSPFVDVPAMDELLAAVAQGLADYAMARLAPAGLVSEAFRLEALERAHELADRPEEREHVTPVLRQRPDIFRQLLVEGPPAPGALDAFPLTIDRPADLAFARDMLAAGLPWPGCTSTDVLSAAQMAARTRRAPGGREATQ